MTPGNNVAATIIVSFPGAKVSTQRSIKIDHYGTKAVMNGTGSRILLLTVCSMLVAGCGAPRIPNAVSDREYEVYSAWISHHFEKEAPKELFLYSRTVVFDPLDGCGDMLHQKDAVPRDVIFRFHNLGTAEYRLDFDSGRTHSQIVFAHQVIDDPPTNAKFRYDELFFSRVAFNRAGDKALFVVSDVCGGDCGSGAP